MFPFADDPPKNMHGNSRFYMNILRNVMDLWVPFSPQTYDLQTECGVKLTFCR